MEVKAPKLLSCQYILIIATLEPKGWQLVVYDCLLIAKVCNPFLKVKISNAATKPTANTGAKIASIDKIVELPDSIVETTALPIPPVSAVEDKRVIPVKA